MHAYIHIHIQTYTHANIHTYTRTHIQAYKHTYMHAYIHSYAHNTYLRVFGPRNTRISDSVTTLAGVYKKLSGVTNFYYIHNSILYLDTKYLQETMLIEQLGLLLLLQVR